MEKNGGNEEIVDEQRGQADCNKAGNDSAEPGASHPRSNEKKQKWVRNSVLEQQRPQEGHEHEKAGDGAGLHAILHGPLREPVRCYGCHDGMITD
jgi:hypothetical protein